MYTYVINKADGRIVLRSTGPLAAPKEGHMHIRSADLHKAGTDKYDLEHQRFTGPTHAMLAERQRVADSAMTEREEVATRMREALKRTPDLRVVFEALMVLPMETVRAILAEEAT